MGGPLTQKQGDGQHVLVGIIYLNTANAANAEASCGKVMLIQQGKSRRNSGQFVQFSNLKPK